MSTNPWINILKKIWRPGLALVLLCILIIKGPFDFKQLEASLKDPSIILIGLILIGLHFVALSYRWRLFVNEYCYLGLPKALQLTLIGQFFSFFIPGGVGGDVVKALELSKDLKVSRQNSLGTVTADRVLGLFSMIFFTALSLIYVSTSHFNSENKTYLFYSISFLVVLVIGLYVGEKINLQLQKWLLQRNYKFSEKLIKILNIFDQTFSKFKNPIFLIRLILISLFVQLTSVTFMYYVVSKLYLNSLSFPLFFAISCFGYILASIPITPSGIGIGQTAFYFLFVRIHPDLGKSAVIAISLLQLFYLFYALIGGFLFTRNSKTLTQVKIHEEIQSYFTKTIA